MGKKNCWGMKIRGLVLAGLCLVSIQGIAIEGMEIQNKVPIILAENKNISLLEEGKKVCAAYEKEKILWAKDKNVLYMSKDEGLTFQTQYTFEQPDIDSVELIGDKVLLAVTSNGRFRKDADAKVYRSLDFGQTFEEVLQVASGSVYHWNIASDTEGTIYLSEYGYKQLPDNARRIYTSKDEGATWEIIYDNGENENNHMHRLYVDATNPNTIYQGIGDGKNNRLIRSKDKGKTWQTVKTAFNPTAVVQIGDEILWGTDTHPRNGIYKIDKKDNLITVFNPPSPYNGSIYDMIVIDDVVYAGFMSYGWESQTWNGSLWASEDRGKTWKLYAEFPKEKGEGIGLYKMTALNGNLYIDSSMNVKDIKTDKKTYYSGTLKIKP